MWKFKTKYLAKEYKMRAIYSDCIPAKIYTYDIIMDEAAIIGFTHVTYVNRTHKHEQYAEN